jgi:sec-independent protein translocase protein TatA
MGAFTIWHWLVVLIIVALVFGGRGKLSGIMGDAAKGVRAFREGLKGEEEAHEEPAPPPKPITKTATKTASKAAPKARANTKA